MSWPTRCRGIVKGRSAPNEDDAVHVGRVGEERDADGVHGAVADAPHGVEYGRGVQVGREVIDRGRSGLHLDDAGAGPDLCIGGMTDDNVVFLVRGDGSSLAVPFKETSEASLRRLRKQRGLTRNEVPGVSAKEFTRTEQGKVTPNAATVRKLGEALGVEPEDIASD